MGPLVRIRRHQVRTTVTAANVMMTVHYSRKQLDGPKGPQPQIHDANEVGAWSLKGESVWGVELTGRVKANTTSQQVNPRGASYEEDQII